MASSTSATASSSSGSQAEYLYHWPIERVVDLVQSTLRTNDILRGETEMFSHYIKNIDITVVNSEAIGRVLSTPADTSAKSSSTDISDRWSQSSRRLRQHTKSSGHGPFEKLLKLKAEDKCEIALKYSEYLKEQRRKELVEADRTINNLKAVMEEATTGTAEVKKDWTEFEKDIVKGSVSEKTHRVIAEKVIRYFEDKMKAKDTYMAKTRLKSHSLRQQKQKACMLLKQKEELGDILTEIDFQQLKIENAERLEKIDERNKDFFRLKTNSALTVYELNTLKRSLHKVTIESTQLNHDINSRKIMIGRLESETRLVKAEKKKAKMINKKHRKNLANYKVPSVMEALSLNTELDMLRENVLIMERKNKIAEMELSAQKKRWNKIQIKFADDQVNVSQNSQLISI